jgi:hypothetical protein
MYPRYPACLGSVSPRGRQPDIIAPFRCSDDGCQMPPRGDLTPRLLSACAIALNVVAPSFPNLRISSLHHLTC